MEAAQVQLTLWHLKNERSNVIHGSPRMMHAYWHIMQISKAINTDVTQTASEQTNGTLSQPSFLMLMHFARSRNYTSEKSHFSMFSKDYSFTQCWIMHIPSWNHFNLPSQAQLHWNVYSVWMLLWCSNYSILIRDVLMRSPQTEVHFKQNSLFIQNCLFLWDKSLLRFLTSFTTGELDIENSFFDSRPNWRGKRERKKNVPKLYHLLKNKGWRVKIYSGTVSPNEHDQEWCIWILYCENYEVKIV